MAKMGFNPLQKLTWDDWPKPLETGRNEGLEPRGMTPAALDRGSEGVDLSVDNHVGDLVNVVEPVLRDSVRVLGPGCEELGFVRNQLDLE